jgi:hypothetical protein
MTLTTMAVRALRRLEANAHHWHQEALTCDYTASAVAAHAREGWYAARDEAVAARDRVIARGERILARFPGAAEYDSHPWPPAR